MKKVSGLLLALGLATGASAPAPPPGTGMLVARVEGPPGQSMPRELAVRVRPSLELVGQEKQAWEHSVSCPVRNGAWTCEVPAGRVDLRITGPAVLPVHRWGVAVRESGTADLGTLKLWRGASITGSVRPNGEIPQYPIQVDLIDMDTWNRDAKPVRTLRLESGSRPWGFFRFDGVPPGVYALMVTDLNLPVLRYGPIRIEGDQAFDIPEPLVLKSLRISVEIQPSKDPYGLPWQVRFAAVPFLATDPFPRPVPVDQGSIDFRNLAPGEYQLSVISESPGGGRWGQQILRLTENRIVRFDLQPVRLRGHVLYKGQSLPRASVEMTGVKTSSGFTFFSHEEGSFEGYVPREDAWKVRVGSSDPRFSIHLEDPVPQPGSGLMEVRVPDTFLPVEVVDTRGKRVQRSEARVLDKVRNSFSQDERLNQPGPLAVVGLKPGAHRLRALQGDPLRSSEEVAVQLHEGKRNPLLRLVLPDVIEIRGRVRPRFGSPKGAQVFVWPADPPKGKSVLGQSTKVGLSGEWDLHLLAPTRKVHGMVLPPGNALRLLENLPLDGKPLDLPVRRAGGTLVLEGHGFLVEVPKRELDTIWQLSPPAMLRHWADLQSTPQSPDRLVVPNVEPGPYTLCPGSPFTLRRGLPKEGEAGCSGGFLKAAGELVLRLSGI